TFVRERVAALTAWYAVHDEPGTFSNSSPPLDVTPARVEAFLQTYYPLYHEASDLGLARAILPPLETPATCTSRRKTDAIVVIPGVVRSTARREFEGQMATVRAAFPCARVTRVEFGSFDDPDLRIVPEVKKVIDRIDHDDGSIPIHLVG